MADNQDSELKEIIEGFNLFGSETEGLINPKEVKEIMDIMNMNEKSPFLYNIIQYIKTKIFIILNFFETFLYEKCIFFN